MTLSASQSEPPTEYAPTPAALLLLAWRLSGCDGEPHGPLASRLRRAIRVIARGRSDPRCAALARGRRRHDVAATRRSHDAALAFVQAALHLRELSRSRSHDWRFISADLTGFQRLAPGAELWRRYRRVPKPWRGATGRAAARGYGAVELEALRRLASEWHECGLSDAAIAERLGCSLKTVSRYLKGRRLRRRTGPQRRGAGGRFAAADRSGHAKRHELAAPSALDSGVCPNTRVQT